MKLHIEWDIIINLVCLQNFFLHLTDVGREVAEKIYERHCFFTEQLIAAGVDPETAEVDACRIEHVISNESFERLKEAAFRKQENNNAPVADEVDPELLAKVLANPEMRALLNSLAKTMK